MLKIDKGPNWKDIYLSNANTLKKALFWTLILALAGLTLKDIRELVIEYVQDLKQADFSMIINDSMTMPNITFCMSKDQAWSHFRHYVPEEAADWDAAVDNALANMTNTDAFMKTRWDYRLVMEAYDTVASLNGIERETVAPGAVRSIFRFRNSTRMAGKRRIVQKWLKAIADRNVSFHDLMQKAGKETLRRSLQRWQRLVKEWDVVIRTGMRITWISQQQLCFQPEFDRGNYPPIEDEGVFFTMLAAHNQENLGTSLQCMSVDFHGRPNSLNRFLGRREAARDGFTNELCAGFQHEVTVTILSHYKALSNEANGTGCKEMEESDDSEFDCHSRCRMEMIRDICGCTASSFAYLVKNTAEFDRHPICDYTLCDISAEAVQNQTFSDTECTKQCRRDCNYIRYDIRHDQKGRMINNGTTLVNLNFGSFEYVKLVQERKWNLATFLATIGGVIGLYLGLSVLSIVQALFLLYGIAWSKITKSTSSYDLRQPTSPGYQAPPQKSKNFGANPFKNPFKQWRIHNRKLNNRRKQVTPEEMPMRPSDADQTRSVANSHAIP